MDSKPVQNRKDRRKQLIRNQLDRNAAPILAQALPRVRPLPNLSLGEAALAGRIM